MVTHDPLEALRLGHNIYVMTGKPAQMSKAIIPPGPPPRKPSDPAIVSLQGELIDRLARTSHEEFGMGELDKK